MATATAKFQMPDQLHKELSATSQKIYKSRLNTLAKAGYDTVDSLLTNKTKVVKAIKEAVATHGDNNRMVARQFVSAISWVCGLEALGANNAYQKYYQTVLPGATSEGEKWVKKNKYNK
jgi:hypothetical protein